MSIETAVERIADKIAESYQVVREKGGALPVQKNIHNLPDAIRTIDGDFAFGSYEWWCPKMTGPNSPAPYAVGAHIWNTTDTPWKAFDGSDKTYWGNVYSNTIKVAHLKFDFGESTKIAGVQLVEYSGNPGGLPKVIAIYGSDDDQNWDEIIIDDRSAWTWCESPRNIPFDVVKYRFYRIDCMGGTWITDSVTGSYTIAIGEVQLATFVRDLSYCPVITLQEKTVTPSTEPQDIFADDGYTGLRNVTIEPAKLQSKTVRASLEQQIVTTEGPYYGLRDVTIDPLQLQTKEVVPTLRAQTIAPDQGYDGLSEVTVAAAKLQKKTIDPSIASQIVTADEGFYGLSKVTVNPIPDQSPPVLQEKIVSPSSVEQEVTPDDGYDGISKVTVEAAPLQAKTIRSSTEVQTVSPDDGVYGLSNVIVDPYILQGKTVSPMLTSQRIVPDKNFDALSEVTIEGVALQAKTVEDVMTPQTVSPDEGYLGLSTVSIPAPKLQEKTVIPAVASTIVVPDKNFDALSKVTVDSIPDVYQDTSDATASPSDILSGKTAYVNGEKVTGTASGINASPALQQKTVTPTTSEQTVTPDTDYDGLSEVTVSAVPLQSKTITPTTSPQTVSPDEGYLGLSNVAVDAIPSDYKDTSDATASASDILINKSAYVNGSKVTGSMPNNVLSTPTINVNASGKITASITQDSGYTPGGTKSASQNLTTQAAQTILPTTTDKTISSGVYLTGTQTIKGDSNLKAANIKSGVSIFGVSGSYAGATPKLQTKTVTPTTSSQSVTPDSNYDALSKVTVNAIPSSYMNTSDATASAADIISGKTAYVNGQKINGTMRAPSGLVTIDMRNDSSTSRVTIYGVSLTTEDYPYPRIVYNTVLENSTGSVTVFPGVIGISYISKTASTAPKKLKVRSRVAVEEDVAHILFYPYIGGSAKLSQTSWVTFDNATSGGSYSCHDFAFTMVQVDSDYTFYLEFADA